MPPRDPAADPVSRRLRRALKAAAPPLLCGALALKAACLCVAPPPAGRGSGSSGGSGQGSGGRSRRSTAAVGLLPAARVPATAEARRPPGAPLPQREIRAVEVERFRHAAPAGDVAPRALAAKAGSPRWAADGSWDALRDGDLATSARCGWPGAPCAVELRFPREVKIHELRLFGGSGESLAAYRAHGRAARLRLHCDRGWLDVELQDTWDHQALQLEPPLVTRQLTVEVRQAYRGSEHADVVIAELEALGVGAPRPPLAIDPGQALARAAERFWSAVGDRWVARSCWIDLAAGAGRPRRLIGGSRIHGAAGDRLLLVERLTDAACGGHGRPRVHSRFTLLDRERRVVRALRWRGVGQLWRAPRGTAWALVPAHTPRTAQLLRLEKTSLQAKTLRAGSAEALSARFRALGLAAVRPRMPCRAATARERAVYRLGPRRGSWQRCEVNSAAPPAERLLLFVLGGGCAERFRALVMPLAGPRKPLATLEGSRAGERLALRRAPDGGWLLAVDANGGDAGHVYRLETAGTPRFVRRQRFASFAVGPPAACRCSSSAAGPRRRRRQRRAVSDPSAPRE